MWMGNKEIKHGRLFYDVKDNNFYYKLGNENEADGKS